MTLKALELRVSEEDALTVKRATELLSSQVALTKWIVVLKELEQPDSVLLDNLFDLVHERRVLTLAFEVCETLNVGSLSTSCWAINDIFEAVGVAQEFGVLDIVVFVTVDECDGVNLCFVNFKS